MSGWIRTKDRLPEEGQEVTVRMSHGQIKQVVKDNHYCGGWKQVNCQGWEIVTWDAGSITHWRPEIFERPEMKGPKDAPWMTQNVEHNRRTAASSPGVRVDGPVGPHRTGEKYGD